jgi:rubrerythrin
MNLLKIAIQMEHDLESFYLKQAELNKDNSLKVVFSLLAKEEENHAIILQHNADKISLPLDEGETLTEVRSIFNEMKDFRTEIRDIPSQLDAYRMALEKEEESIKFYKDLQKDAKDDQSKTVFQYLINQEDKHSVILEELIKLVTRPEEWVESAEFGIREDY